MSAVTEHRMGALTGNTVSLSGAWATVMGSHKFVIALEYCPWVFLCVWSSLCGRPRLTAVLSTLPFHPWPKRH